MIRAACAELDARCLEYSIANECGPDDYVFDLCVELGGWYKTAEALGISPASLNKWAKRGGDARIKAKEAAIREAAETLAHQGQEILDDLDGKTLLTGPEVQLASKRADYRLKMAGFRDRERFGDAPQVQLNVSLGDLHMSALLKHGTMTPIPSSPAPDDAVAFEGELIEETDAIAELNASTH